MKILTIILLSSLVILISACSKDKEKITVNTTLPGKWKLERTYASNGSTTYWTPVKTSTYVTFGTDGNMSGNAFGDYKRYTVKDSITLLFTADDTTKHENFYYKIKGDSLNTSSVDYICIEGCGSQFIKVK